MRVRVLLFGPFADAIEGGGVFVEIPAAAPATAHAVLAALGEQQPSLREKLALSRLAVNHQLVSPDHPVDERDELAVVGLVSGG